jgi:hypothetical protein
MENTTIDNNKKGILAPLLKTIDFLLAKLRYDDNSKIRKKLEPAILVVVLILLGFIVALFSNLINFDIKRFVGAFIGIPILLVIGTWIISAFSIKEKTKKRLGILFIVLAVFGFLIYILFENRQVLYNLKKEFDTELNQDINMTKIETEINKDTTSFTHDYDKIDAKEKIEKKNQFTFIVKKADKRIANTNIEVETQYGIFNGTTDESGKALIEIKGKIDQNISYKITVNGIQFCEPIKNVTTLTLP